MTHETDARRVDHSAIRVNQVFTIGLLIVAFVLNAPWLAAAVALINLVGALFPSASLFRRIYLHILQPAGWVKPDVTVDNPEPHRFAQGVGGVCVGLGVLALTAALSVPGWALVWLVVVLASANLLLGFCAGCFVYYQLNRLGVPGFHRSPIGEE